VVYLGSFTRVLAPALRLGFLTGPHGLVDRLASLRLASDWQGDRVLEGALREIILDGTFLRHVRKTRAIYRGRRDRFLDLLAAELPRQIRCTPPAAGLSLWATLLHPLRDLAARCSQQGLRVHSGSHFSISMDPLPCLQLGFAALEDEEQHLAIGRLALAMQP
jgi:GntR family transcriptional regulator/MocR family aminotransferase